MLFTSSMGLILSIAIIIRRLLPDFKDIFIKRPLISPRSPREKHKELNEESWSRGEGKSGEYWSDKIFKAIIVQFSRVDFWVLLYLFTLSYNTFEYINLFTSADLVHKEI